MKIEKVPWALCQDGVDTERAGLGEWREEKGNTQKLCFSEGQGRHSLFQGHSPMGTRVASGTASIVKLCSMRFLQRCNMAIPSVRLSHAGTLSRRMKIGWRDRHCEIAKTLVFWYKQRLGATTPSTSNLRSMWPTSLWKAPTLTNICL